METGVKTKGTPRLMTIRQVAATKIMPECALRRMQKEGRLPCIMVGKKALINFDRLLEQLECL